MQRKQADDDQAGVADDGKGHQAAQVRLPEGHCRRKKDADHGEGDHVGLPEHHGIGGQRQQEARHSVDPHLDAEQQHRTDGDQAVTGRVGQPAVQRKQRRAHRQPVEQQVEGRRLVLADLRRLQQFEQVEAPVTADDIDVAPGEDDGAGHEQAPAEQLILEEARQRETLFRRRGPAPEQVADECQLDGRGGGKPEQVHRGQHRHQRRFGEQQDAEQAHRRDLLACHAIERQQGPEQGREQDEEHADAVGGRVIGELIDTLGELQDARRHVDARVQVDGDDQFADGKNPAEDERQILLAHDQQQQRTGQRQPLQGRQRRIADLRGPEHFVHRITTKVAITISIR
jgi:hypothetical protein